MDAVPGYALLDSGLLPIKTTAEMRIELKLILQFNYEDACTEHLRHKSPLGMRK